MKTCPEELQAKLENIEEKRQSCQMDMELRKQKAEGLQGQLWKHTSGSKAGWRVLESLC